MISTIDDFYVHCSKPAKIRSLDTFINFRILLIKTCLSTFMNINSFSFQNLLAFDADIPLGSVVRNAYRPVSKLVPDFNFKLGIVSFLRYLAARNFMLSGTALLRGMTYTCCEELGTFKPSFHPQH